MGNLARYTGAELAPASAAARNDDAQEVHRLWSAVLRRWRLFLLITFGFTALVTLATVLTPKSYTTSVRLMAGKPSSGIDNSADRDTSLPILNALVLQSGELSAETFTELAQQENISAQVVSNLNLPISARALLRDVSVKPVVNTSLLTLSVSWKTPEGSARVANEYAGVFINAERDFVRSEATAAIAYLSDELPRAQQRMRETASALARFQARNGFIDAGLHTQDVVSRVAAIDQKIDALGVDTREAQALLRNVTAQMSSMPSSIDSSKQITYNPVLADLRTKLAAVDTQLAAARQQYTDEHPTVVALKQQREALLAQVAAQPSSIQSGSTTAPNPIYQTLAQQAANYRARIDGNGAQVKELGDERKAYAPLLGALPSEAMQFASIQQDAKRAADVYNALAQKYNDALIARTTAISDISIVQPATADSAVRRPRLAVNIGIGFVVGLVLSLATVFVLELFEQRVRSDSDVALMLGLPLIARIPAFDTANPRMLPWVQSMTIEAFLHFCVTLRLKNKRPLHSIAITSACRGDGKSTVAFNLAKAMANLQPRILLIDGDLRRPSLHEHAGCRNDIGLSDVLQGKRTFAESVREIAPNLDLLTSGPEAMNPVALLQSTRFDELLTSETGSYAMIIVDTPPLASVTDGLLISARVEGTAFVVAANSTDELSAKRAVSQFAALGLDNILGVVLNRDTKRFDDYSDYFARSFGRELPSGN
jgi:succinoglycan biosynthesis transport protein ExoP